MTATLSLVQRVHIASPCPASWDAMTGDEQVRFCSRCKLNVYNLSAMTQEEGERLILEKEGRLCARIYRRADGTVLTRDCPVGLAALRRRIVGLGLKVAAALAFIAASTAYAIGTNSLLPDSVEYWFAGRPTPFRRTVAVMQRWMNGAPPQRGWISGDISPTSFIPTPTTPPAQNGSVSDGPDPAINSG